MITNLGTQWYTVVYCGGVMYLTQGDGYVTSMEGVLTLSGTLVRLVDQLIVNHVVERPVKHGVGQCT